MIANVERCFLAVIFIIYTNVPKISAIQCYKCYHTTPWYYKNETIRLCRDFDSSDEFIVDCPYSTFCVKKRFTARIAGLINGTERGCASQKDETQVYSNGSWHPKVSISEAYQEGCLKEENKGQKTSIEYNCYCKGSLCNTGYTTLGSYNVIILSVILLYCKLFTYVWS